MLSYFDEQSGATIQLHRYYGFCDSGSIAGSFEGYPTQEECILRMVDYYAALDQISTQPEDLGRIAVCVLSGRQYVDERKKHEQP